MSFRYLQTNDSCDQYPQQESSQSMNRIYDLLYSDPDLIPDCLGLHDWINICSDNDILQ